jgi:hypothetical protein
MRRHCQLPGCGLKLVRRPGETLWNFERRKTCCPAHAKALIEINRPSRLTGPARLCPYCHRPARGASKTCGCDECSRRAKLDGQQAYRDAMATSNVIRLQAARHYQRLPVLELEPRPDVVILAPRPAPVKRYPAWVAKYLPVRPGSAALYQDDLNAIADRGEPAQLSQITRPEAAVGSLLVRGASSPLRRGVHPRGTR